MKRKQPPKATITEETSAETIQHPEDNQPTEAATIAKHPQPEVNPTEALTKTEAALAKANDKYIRLYSEFENFKKRTSKEKLAMLETANEAVLKQLLPIVDDFERALDTFQQDSASTETVQTGIKLIYDKIRHLFNQLGVRPMAIEKGAEFDATCYEAVTQTPVEDKSMQGKVVDVIEKGYLLQSHVLRFAKVVIGS